MPEYVSQRINHAADARSQDELRVLFNTLVDAVRAVAAKLDADATVTDTNYAALVDTYILK